MSYNINVVCPKCEQQEMYAYTGPLEEKVECKQCSSEFSFIYATTRAKKSRGSRKDNRREFDIRVYLNDGSEKFIQFVNSGYDDIELRSKDEVVIAFLDDKVRILQNLKIDQYTSISEPSCYIATYIYGPYSSEVVFLRKWRDDSLNCSAFGRAFISLYYSISPVLLQYCSKNKFFSKYTKFLVSILLKSLGYKT